VAGKTKEKATKKRAKRKVVTGKAFIQATYNNTIISLTDTDGSLLGQGSPAVVGYKGAKRSTAYAATQAAKDVAEKVMKQYGLSEVSVVIKGPGSGRNAAVKGLDVAGLKITQLIDRTPVPHNGCRPRKAPRN
jgi:small subunit ribosomal protein S11